MIIDGWTELTFSPAYMNKIYRMMCFIDSKDFFVQHHGLRVYLIAWESCRFGLKVSVFPMWKTLLIWVYNLLGGCGLLSVYCFHFHCIHLLSSSVLVSCWVITEMCFSLKESIFLLLKYISYPTISCGDGRKPYKRNYTHQEFSFPWHVPF